MGVKAGEGREDSVILTPPPLPLSLFLTVDRPFGMVKITDGGHDFR